MANVHGLANIVDYGADPLGINDCSQALLQALQAESDVLVPNGTFRMSKSATIPNGTTLHFRSRGAFSIDAGQSLNIRGRVDAPLAQIFKGSAAVSGMRLARPEWFGALGDSVHDDTDAIQSAIACVGSSSFSDGDRFMVKLGAKRSYLITRTIILQPTFSLPISMVGEGVTAGGTRIIVKDADIGIWIKADVGATQPTQFELANFQVGRSGNVSRVGILVGADANSPAYLTSNGLTYSCLRDILVEQFPTCIRLLNAYGIHLQRCTVANHLVDDGIGVEVYSQGTGVSAGDLIFDNCTLIASKSNTARNVLLSATTNGVHFRDCTFYGGYHSLQIYASGVDAAGAPMGVTDVWFANCSWDAGGVPFPRNYILIHADAQAIVQNVLFSGCYWRGCSDTHVILQNTNGGAVLDVRFVNGWAGDAEGFFLSTTGCSGVVVDAMTMQNIGCPNGTLTNCYLKDTQHFSITNNHSRLSPGAQGGPICLVYVDGSSDFFTITGNMGPTTKETITDTTPPNRSKSVTGNWS